MEQPIDGSTQLVTQMYASIRYIQTHHNFASIPSQPDMNPYSRSQPGSVPPSALLPPESNGIPAAGSPPTAQTQQANAQNGTEDATGLRPDPPDVFAEALTELAQDLVVKEQQVELLIDVLPGIGRSEAEQVARIRELEGRLREVEGRRQEAVREKERCVERLDGVIARVRRV
ncbi:MAG: RNA polymerase II mediator complex subunit [Bathelium mastoideum]|nr:MAG: RNA polymerase II mediator complex subunit [Bathelium mastoideum]